MLVEFSLRNIRNIHLKIFLFPKTLFHLSLEFLLTYFSFSKFLFLFQLFNFVDFQNSCRFLLFYPLQWQTIAALNLKLHFIFYFFINQLELLACLPLLLTNSIVFLLLPVFVVYSNKHTWHQVNVFPPNYFSGQFDDLCASRILNRLDKYRSIH